MSRHTGSRSLSLTSVARIDAPSGLLVIHAVQLCRGQALSIGCNHRIIACASQGVAQAAITMAVGAGTWNVIVRSRVPL